MREAVLAGMKAQLRADRHTREGEVGIHSAMDDGDGEVAGDARRGPASDIDIF